MTWIDAMIRIWDRIVYIIAVWHILFNAKSKVTKPLVCYSIDYTIIFYGIVNVSNGFGTRIIFNFTLKARAQCTHRHTTRWCHFNLTTHFYSLSVFLTTRYIEKRTHAQMRSTKFTQNKNTLTNSKNFPIDSRLTAIFVGLLLLFFCRLDSKIQK